MINWAVRYKPIILELNKIRPTWVLEVGSGSEGLKLFWRGRVVGVDIGFKRWPIHTGVKASGLALPFTDNSWPAVVCCDTLEHIPPQDRHQAVVQMARVAKDDLLLVFPSGEISMQIYRELAQKLDHQDMPLWLEQHLEYGLPDAGQVVEWLNELGWDTSICWYESAYAHLRLMCWETQYPGKFLTYSLMRLVGPILAPLMKVSTKKPNLRVFIKATRNEIH